MRKIMLLLPMLFICMMFSAIAYTVVDYESFNYTGGGDLLYLNGWRNDSVGSIDQCQTLSGFMYCAGTGSNKNLYHTLNQKPVGYCVSRNGSYGDFARNFSIRYQIAMVDFTKTSSDIVWTGAGSYINTTTTGRFLDLQTRIYANYSGYSLRPEDFLWETAGGITAPIVRDTVMGDWHTVQMDFFVTNASFPLGAQNIYSGNISVINSTGLVYNYASGTNSAAYTDYYCLNASFFRFNTDFILDNLYMVEYNESEYFIPINQSITIGSTYECSDGLDNDADGFTDMDDPSCDSTIDNAEAPFDSTECNDGEDNDVDGLIDYPADPACSSFLDNSEAPQNTFQCNDGSDNDGDGFTDYPADPSCSGFSDTTESPVDGTIQNDDLCSLSESCLFKTTFPYSDSIYFHGWRNVAGDGLSNIALLPSGATNGLLFDNYGTTTEADLEKNFTYPMSYDYMNGEFTIQLKYIACAYCFDNHKMFFALQDDSNVNQLLLEMDINTSVANQFPMNLYLINQTGGKQFISTYNLNSFSYFTNIVFSIDNLNNTVTINGYNLPLSNITAPSKVRIYVDELNYDSRNLGFYFSKIQLYGQISTESVCTDYTPPYYLKEDFNFGYLTDCGWAIQPDLLVNSKLKVDSSLDYLYAVKNMYDTKAETFVKLNNRFTTITFDYKPISTSATISALTLFVYDYPTKNIITSISFDKNGQVYAYPDGSPQLLSTLMTDTTSQIKLIFDMSTDNFKYYVNNALVSSNVGFNDEEYDYTDIYSIYLTSSYSDYELDSLYVFTSDAIGVPMLSLGSTLPTMANNQTLLFGIIYKATPACVQDSDCLSGQCTNFKKCAAPNYKMCDEYGYNRTDWCFVKLLFSKVLEWVVNLILDNFLIFLGLLILLMFSLFLWGHMRRR